MTRLKFKMNGAYIVNIATIDDDRFHFIKTFMVTDKYNTEEELISTLISEYELNEDDERVTGYEIVSHITGISSVLGDIGYCYIGCEIIDD